MRHYSSCRIRFRHIISPFRYEAMTHTRNATSLSHILINSYFFFFTFLLHFVLQSSIRSQTTSQFTYFQLVALILLSSMSLLYRISHHICYTTILGSHTRSRSVAPVLVVSIHVKRLVFTTSFWFSNTYIKFAKTSSWRDKAPGPK
jgi:hypothetical protein